MDKIERDPEVTAHVKRLLEADQEQPNRHGLARPLTQRRFDMELTAMWAAAAHGGYKNAKECLARCREMTIRDPELAHSADGGPEDLDYAERFLMGKGKVR